ncbi:GFA family protein [Pseudomonas sp. Irchel 3E20]|uniref:GFA family protein n=1 Tax=Pseudomonas sp. Irchel 3E20 TaxID=2008983 RepID=UPI000BA4AE54|nr:GFA family protein [Pseudomonas sp. Irchel 3E20]
MSAAVYEGGCLCGQVRFAARGEALNPHSCSCRNCQRHSGALTLCWVEFPKGAVQWTGEGGEPARYRSSDYSSRAFCPVCGSTLGALDDEPVVALLLGSFDQPVQPALQPQSHSFADGCPPGWHP